MPSIRRFIKKITMKLNLIKKNIVYSKIIQFQTKKTNPTK